MGSSFFLQNGIAGLLAQSMLSLWMLITYQGQAVLTLESWGNTIICRYENALNCSLLYYIYLFRVHGPRDLQLFMDLCKKSWLVYRNMKNPYWQHWMGCKTHFSQSKDDSLLNSTSYLLLGEHCMMSHNETSLFQSNLNLTGTIVSHPSLLALEGLVYDCMEEKIIWSPPTTQKWN